MPVRSKSLRFGVLQGVLVAALGVGAYVVARSDDDGRRVVERERAALAVVERLAAAERTYRDRKARDDDHDGVAEYGSLADLVTAGLVEGPVVEDADGPHLDVGSYRVEVLLPGGIDRGRRAWARGRRAVDPRGAAETFAVVAVPDARRPRALRGIYVDGEGRRYYAEAVYEADREPSIRVPLRELRDEKETGGHDDATPWRVQGAPPPPRKP